MREFKFRAYDPEKKEWIKHFNINQDGFIDDFNSSKAIISEWVGLKDKSGKDIYQYDIIQCENEIGQVYWNQFSCGFRVSRNIDDNIENTSFLVPWGQSMYEVVVNMFENPELLEQKQG